MLSVSGGVGWRLCGASNTAPLLDNYGDFQVLAQLPTSRLTIPRYARCSFKRGTREASWKILWMRITNKKKAVTTVTAFDAQEPTADQSSAISASVSAASISCADTVTSFWASRLRLRSA